MNSGNPRIITEEFISEYFNINLQEAKEIHNSLERIECDNNQTIVLAGTKADGIYFIDEGQVTVFNTEGESVNEMEAGQYFGEYAILAEEKRMSTVKAHGKAVVYRMKPAVFLNTVSRHPTIIGRLLKQVYSQISDKHTKLATLTRRHRGIIVTSSEQKREKASDVIITYGITALIFLFAVLGTPYIDSQNPGWQLLPIAFLMAFVLKTRRILEGMLLTVMLLSAMLNNGHLLKGFQEMMIVGLGNTDTAETILIMAMVEIISALLSSAGIISVFKKWAERRVHTRKGSMFAMLFLLILICLDECLNVMAAGFCLNEAEDKQKIPREERALLGSFSTAICAMIPFSMWTAYISGWVSLYVSNGGNVFLKSIPYNLIGIFALVFSVFLCTGFFPKTRQIREANRRVVNGGELWPDDSERYMETETDDQVIGKAANLILPMFVWAISSVLFGMIKNPDVFAMDAISGLVVTIVFMFFFYIGQKLMTPTRFFDILTEGIGNSLVLILLLVLEERISEALIALGFGTMFEHAIVQITNGKLFLVPMLIFVIYSLICMGLGSSWSMYGLGIPMSILLAQNLGLSMPLCLGAVLAAGIVGDNLCPFMDETSPVVTSIGCSPRAYRKIRLQYWIPISIICSIGYIFLGFIM